MNELTVFILLFFFCPCGLKFQCFLLSPTAAAEEEEKKKQKAYDPWGRPGAGAPQKKPESDSQEDSQFRTKEVLSLYMSVGICALIYSMFPLKTCCT